MPPSAPVPSSSNNRRFPPLCRSREEVAEVYNTPMMELVYQAANVHRMYNDPSMVRKLIVGVPKAHARNAHD